MTQKKLAELTGTSVSTVSKAFSGSREISEETRARIYEAAREAGCFGKYDKSKRSRPMIAVLHPETESEYYGYLAGRLERELTERGCDTVMAATRFDKKQEAYLFEELAYRLKVDGAILIGTGEEIRNTEDFPLVILCGKNRSPSRSEIVWMRGKTAFHDALHYLKRMGHRDIGFIGEAKTVATQEQFCAIMRELGLPVREEWLILAEGRFCEAGENAMRRLLELPELPTALFAAYDQIAIGAMSVARQNGLSVPEDVSFIGRNDIGVAAYLDVPLTTISTNIDEICGSVIDLVLKKCENRHYHLRSPLSMHEELKIRASVADLRSKRR